MVLNVVLGFLYTSKYTEIICSWFVVVYYSLFRLHCKNE